MSETVNDVFRSGSFGAVIPPNSASPYAQTENTGGPLNIRHIKRGHALVTLTNVSGQLVQSEPETVDPWTVNPWRRVSEDLSLTMAVSERPVVIQCNLTYRGGDANGSATGNLAFSFSIDDFEVTNRTYGLASPDAGTNIIPISFTWIATPGPGTHTIALCSKVVSGTAGTIYCDGDVVVLTAREI